MEKIQSALKKSWKYILLILGPIADYYLMEAFCINAFTTTRWRAQILNIIAFELVMLLLFFIIGRLVISLEIGTVFFMVAGLMNYFILQFRSSPIVPWDVYSLRTAVSVADNYEWSLGTMQILVIMGFVFLFVIQLTARLKLDRKKWLVRLTGAVAVTAVFFGFAKMLQTEEWVSKWKLYPYLFTPTYMCQANGFFVTYIMDFQYLSVDKPEGYSAEAAEELLAQYAGEESNVSSEQGTGTQQETEADTLPNIIVIMDEAFSDLGVLGDLPVNTDYMPFIHSLEEGSENTITGYLNVSVLGGNTANTEFEYLTGNTMAFLPAGSIPYQQYITGEIPSLAEYLAGLGYETYAMHPYRSTGWNRDKVYPYLGFENIFFMDDFYNPAYVREYISDKSDFEKIIDTYERRKGNGPFFMFNVTMQNHGSYGDSYPNLIEDVEAEGVTSQYLNRYLSLIKITDSDLEELVDYFREEEEPTVIVFFGDHQPNDTVAEPVWRLNGTTTADLTEEETDRRYEVPYVIWANYDIAEQTGADTSVNYLAAKTLQAAGVPLSEYQNYLLSLSESYPVISAEKIQDADGNTCSLEEIEDELKEYQMLQYYQLFDAKTGEQTE